MGAEGGELAVVECRDVGANGGRMAELVERGPGAASATVARFRQRGVDVKRTGIDSELHRPRRPVRLRRMGPGDRQEPRPGIDLASPGATGEAENGLIP